MKSIKTKNHIISNDNLYFIADIGANHDGSLNKAIELIHIVKESGGHAAKFQNFSAKKIVSKTEFDRLPKSTHQASWKKTVYEVYQEASISKDWTEILKLECDKVGLDYFTSPYDFDAVDHVDPFVDLYKIGSGDITWLEIIEYVLRKNKPIIIASGASELEDVKRVMALILKYNSPHVLMQCNTNYTGSRENFKYLNLNVLRKYAELYPNTILGLSDHTAGHSSTLGAITLGARVIEKHFTDSNSNAGPDHFFAMNPQSWKDMVDASEELFQSLGDGIKKIEENEKQSFKVQRRSICINRNIQKGEVIRKEDLTYLRPYSEHSFHPFEYNLVIGKVINSDLLSGSSIHEKHLI